MLGQTCTRFFLIKAATRSLVVCVLIVIFCAVAPTKGIAASSLLFRPHVHQGKQYFYRIPSIVTVNKNTFVVAFAEQRVSDNTDYGDINVVARVSYDHGKSWTPIKVVCDLGPKTCGNPTAVVDQTTGTIHLFMMSNADDLCQLRRDVGKNACTSNFGAGTRRVRYLKARFQGQDLVFNASGSSIPDLTNTLQFKGTKFDLIGPGTGIQLTAPGKFKGRLLVPALGRTFISDNNGKTWRLGKGRLGGASSEPTLMELDSGRILRNDRVSGSSRDKYPTRLLSYSGDGGETFPAGKNGKYQSLSVPDPKAQASMLRYAPGQLFFANCASATKRQNLTIRRTFDEGQSWTDSRKIDSKCGYSSMTKTRDFHIGILYERPAQNVSQALRSEKPLDILFRKFPLSHFDN